MASTLKCWVSVLCSPIAIGMSRAAWHSCLSRNDFMPSAHPSVAGYLDRMHLLIVNVQLGIAAVDAGDLFRCAITPNKRSKAMLNRS